MNTRIAWICFPYEMITIPFSTYFLSKSFEQVFSSGKCKLFVDFTYASLKRKLNKNISVKLQHGGCVEA